MPELLSLGEPMLEFAQVEREGRPVYLQGFGGDTSNMAVAAARQGADVGIMTRIGQDPFGDAFMGLWQREKIDVSRVTRDASHPTGVYFITYSGQGHDFTYYRRGSAASQLQPGDIKAGHLEGVKVLHLSGISQAISQSACDATFKALELAKEHGVKVSYDTNLRLKLWPVHRARAVTFETVRYCDYCLPSLEDATTLTGVNDPEAIVDFFLDKGAASVVLKLGADGALVSDSRQRELIPAHSVEVVDATGAGDTFDGAFIAGVLRGRTVFDAARTANAAAALSTRDHGAVHPMPTRDEVDNFLKSVV